MSPTDPRRPDQSAQQPATPAVFKPPDAAQSPFHTTPPDLPKFGGLATPHMPPSTVGQQQPEQTDQAGPGPERLSLPTPPPAKPAPPLQPSRMTGYRPPASSRPIRRPVDALPDLNRNRAEQDLLQEHQTPLQRLCQYLHQIGKCPPAGCVRRFPPL